MTGKHHKNEKSAGYEKSLPVQRPGTNYSIPTGRQKLFAIALFF
jgi:hypothetical protein